MSTAKDTLTKKKGEMDEILDLVNNMKFDEDSIKGQTADEVKVAWYCERFDRCIEDGVPSAINCYLQKLQSETVNEFTRVCILHEALNRQLDK